MRNLKSIINLLLLTLAFMNVALAENPDCPEPKSIQQYKWLAGDIACDANHCLYKMGGPEDIFFSFDTGYYWHFYIDFKINSLEDIAFAKSKTLSIIDSLVSQGKADANYTCLYSNAQGAIAKAVITNIHIHPDSDNL
jgi:hypothetical protein